VSAVTLVVAKAVTDAVANAGLAALRASTAIDRDATIHFFIEFPVVFPFR
jgi:hypothetical protein